MLPPLIRGVDRACFAVTEPDAGLNTLKIKTRATREGDHYRVNGQKIWISTAQVANKILLLARTTPIEEVTESTKGLSLFYTDLDRRFVDVREIEKMGRARQPVGAVARQSPAAQQYASLWQEVWKRSRKP